MQRRATTSLLLRVAVALISVGALMGGAIPAAATGSGSISGSVYLTTAGVRAGAGDVLVEFTKVGQDHLAEDFVPTDASGNFVIPGLDAGAYNVYFHYVGSAGYYSQWGYHSPQTTSPSPGGEVVVGSGATTLYPTLFRAGTLSGVVKLGSTGTLASAGEVEVFLRAYVNNTWTDGVPITVDANGRYIFDPVTPGGYEVVARYVGTGPYQPGEWLAYPQSVVNDKVGPVTRDITVPAFASLSGRVSLGTPDNFAGAGEVTVTVSSTDSEDNALVAGLSAVTDSDGYYRLDRLGNESYTLHLAYSGNAGWEQQTEISVTTYADVNVKDVTIAPSVTLSGKVTLGDQYKAAPAGSVRVILRAGGPSSTVLYSTLVDSSGLYSIPNIRPGGYTLLFDYVGSGNYNDRFWPHSGEWYQAGYFVLNESREVDMTLGADGVVMGRTVQEDSGYIEGVHVYLTQYFASGPKVGQVSASFDMVTDGNGIFEFFNLPRNFYYTLDFDGEATDYASMAWQDRSLYYFGDPIDLSVDAEQHLRVTMKVPGSIVGTVAGSGYVADPADLWVEVLVFDYATNAWVQTGDEYPVNGDGSYTIDRLYPDNVRVAAYYEGPLGAGSVVSSTLSVTSGKATTFNAVVPRSEFATGSLVKVASSSTVYLVDGAKQLIPLRSADFAVDAGLATSVETIATLSGYSVGATPMSNVVLCSGIRYIAAEGQLWPVAYALVSGIATTTLSTSTCARLTKSTTTISGALLLRQVGKGTVYAVQPDGVRRSASSPARVLLAAPYAPEILDVNGAFISSLPLGPAAITPGTLVKSAASSQLYLADGLSKLIPVSAGVITDAGIPTTVTTLSTTDMAKMQVLTAPLRNLISCNGTTFIAGSGKLWTVKPSLVTGIPVTSISAGTCANLPKATTAINRGVFAKSATSPTVYNIVAGGSKRELVAASSVTQLSAPDVAVTLVVNDAFLASLTTGTTVLPLGGLIKASGSTTVYLVDGASSLIKVRSTDVMTDFGLSATVSTVPASRITGLTVAANSLSNIVRCSDRNWIATGGEIRKVATSAVGTLPTTQLSTLCNVLTRGTVSVADPTYIKSAAYSKIYLLSAGKKTQVGTTSTFSGTWVTVNKSFADSVPMG